MEDRLDVLPLYERVRRTILADIESGRFSPGSFLPGEPELMAQFQVSRSTVREALRASRTDGVVK